MKLRLVITAVLTGIFMTALSQSVESPLIDRQAKGMEMGQFSNYLRTQHQIIIYYQPALVKDLSINFTADTIKLHDLLKQILAPLSLDFLQQNQQIYILPVDKAFEDAEIRGKIPSTVRSIDSADQVSQNYFGKYSYDKTVNKVVIGQRGDNAIGETCFITGRILNNTNGEPVIGATVVVPGTSIGAITDSEGTFSLPLNSGQSYNLQVSCLGMEQSRYLIDMQGSGILNIEMAPKMIDMQEVVVRAKEHHNVRGMQMGFQRVAMKEVKSIPTVMGEKDILKVANLMPGVQTVGEGAAGFNVRGSSSDQNLFLLNGIPVLNTGHLFGFFSAFNPDMISGFNLYKGNFPVEYSGRLASVFEITTRKGNKKEFGARGSISPVTGSFMMETPLVKDKSSFTLAARSTYSDWILNRLDDAEYYERDASFYDIMSGLHVIGRNNDSWQVFLYHSKDKFSLSTTNKYRYENLGGSISYTRPVFGRWNLSTTGSISNYQNYQLNQEEDAKGYEHEFDVRSHELKFNLSGYPWAGHKLGLGGNLIWHALNQGWLNPVGDLSILRPIDFGSENGLEYGLHAFDEISVTDKLSVYLGLRYSLFNYLGPNTVYSYAPNSPRESDYITDTTAYPAGKTIAHYSGPEYRFAMNYSISPDFSAKLSYNRMRQYLFMLSNTAAISPTDRWKLTDKFISPPVADQVSFGLYKNFNNSSIETSAEVYYKHTHNSIDYKDGADLSFTPEIETLVLQGLQKAYGVEAFIKRNTGRLTGWAAYTYSRSLININGNEAWEKINNGLTYPANYDKPHAVNLVGSYRFSRRLSLSSNLVYGTGRPVTTPTGYFYVDGYQVINYSLRNEYRVPDYFRIDLSVNIEGNLKKEKFAHGSWMFSVYNLTGRKNAYSVYFNNDRGQIKGYQLSIYGVPIFTISYNFKLGNYAVE